MNINGQPQQPDDGINRLNVDINDPSSASRLAEQIKQQMASQQQTGGSEDDDDEEPEEGEANDGEDLLKGYDENGNEINEEDLPDDDEKKDGAKKEEDSKKEKTEL